MKVQRYVLGIFFNFFWQIIDQFNTSCRRYGNLEGIWVSRFFWRFGRVQKARKVLKSSRFWKLGGSTRSSFEKKPCLSHKEGFFMDLSCKWAIHSRIGTASTVSTTLIEFARPIWSTPASWKKKLKRLDSLWSMVAWVVSFQAGGTKLERFLTKNQLKYSK